MIAHISSWLYPNNQSPYAPHDDPNNQRSCGLGDEIQRTKAHVHVMTKPKEPKPKCNSWGDISVSFPLCVRRMPSVTHFFATVRNTSDVPSGLGQWGLHCNGVGWVLDSHVTLMGTRVPNIHSVAISLKVFKLSIVVLPLRVESDPKNQS